MGLFDAIVRTCVNVVKLPIELSVAVLKDVVEVMASGDCEPVNTKEAIKELKEESKA
jgi:hypothetical protein